MKNIIVLFSLKLKNRGPTPTTSTVAMMELPNYSSQLLQQLWALRKEGHLCDCTILVGDTHHHAHKLVLAASSMLFRYTTFLLTLPQKAAEAVFSVEHFHTL